MIEIKNVRKSYGSTVVVDDVSVTVPKGGVTSIIGPNGAGKSTLLSMIGRLLPADKGMISVDGLDVASTPGNVLARRLSLLRQDNHLAARLTVRDLVTFGRYPYSKGRYTVDDERYVRESITYLGLEAYADRFLDELSGGQRQRAFVAMVMCQDTDYLLLDEPLNNLDIRHTVDIMRLVQRTAHERGKTVLIVLHDINMASAYSDSILAMKDGRVAAHGTVEDVVQQELLSEIYETEIVVQKLMDRRIAVY